MTAGGAVGNDLCHLPGDIPLCGSAEPGSAHQEPFPGKKKKPAGKADFCEAVNSLTCAGSSHRIHFSAPSASLGRLPAGLCIPELPELAPRAFLWGKTAQKTLLLGKKLPGSGGRRRGEMSASEEEEDEAALHTGMRHFPAPGGAGFVPRGNLWRRKSPISGVPSLPEI